MSDTNFEARLHGHRIWLTNPSPCAAWRQNSSSRYRRASDRVVHDGTAVAASYNQAGGDYVAYADGDPTHLFAFNGLHTHMPTGGFGLFLRRN